MWIELPPLHEITGDMKLVIRRNSSQLVSTRNWKFAQKNYSNSVRPSAARRKDETIQNPQVAFEQLTVRLQAVVVKVRTLHHTGPAREEYIPRKERKSHVHHVDHKRKMVDSCIVEKPVVCRLADQLRSQSISQHVSCQELSVYLCPVLDPASNILVAARRLNEWRILLELRACCAVL